MPRFRPPRFVLRLWVWIARHGNVLATMALSLLLAGVGWLALQWREILWRRIGDEKVDWQEMGMDPFQRLSFDVPFLMRYSLPDWLRPMSGPLGSTEGVVLLYMDEDSADRLHQPPGAWSRAMHAKLLNWLVQDGARAVFFDIVFSPSDPAEEPALKEAQAKEDAALKEAIGKQGHVFVGARLVTNSEASLSPEEAQRFMQVGIATEQMKRSDRELTKQAQGWGLLTFRPIDADYGVRRLFPGQRRVEGLDPWPAATWRLAQAMGAELPTDEGEWFRPRWLNYYGVHRILSMSYYRALVADGDVPPGFFKDKVVFVGARSQLATSASKLQDEFSTPYSHFSNRALTPGLEIHATSYLNLMQHDWLERFPVSAEFWIVLAIGLALGPLRLLRPRWAVILAIVSALTLFAGACLMQWRLRLWCNWAVPVLLQIPLAAVLAVASRYYLEERRKRKLRAAFGLYLSPELASEIAERNFTLAPGGEKVVATMLFTDLAGYATLAEELGDSKRLGEELTRYFTRTTDEILKENGTVIKFIGDCVYAAWGAPLPQPDHAVRAVRAAWHMAQVCDMDISIPKADGRTEIVSIHTRIGIHTGEALAGNLGSAKRFDYTLIGDAVNFASRLEGANKYLGTTVLLSDDTAQLLGGKFLLRRLGTFIVVGKKKPEVVHELLGLDPSVRPPWMETFEAGLAAWNARDFVAAKAAFDDVCAAREGGDGPSKFYLERLKQAALAVDLFSENWMGAVTLEGK